MTKLRIALAAISIALLGGCGADVDATYPTGASGQKERLVERSGSVAGPEGIHLFGGPEEPGTGGGGLAVNSFLWRASLDTMSFMPLASADPFGGVIITDWYAPPETPTERFKVTIYILGRELRADGLRASVFRQVQGIDGAWVDSGVDPKTAAELENAILVRARQMRIAGLQ